jgi:tetratricopeptide (TPR) repeat protein
VIVTFLCGGLLLLALTPASASAEAAAAPLYAVDATQRKSPSPPPTPPSGAASDDAVERARALLESGQLDDARKLAAELVAANIGTVREGMLRNLQGDIEERAGNLVAAAEAFQRAAHLDASEEHLFDWGNNLLALRAPDDAVQVFEAAIKRHPTSARLHVGLGIGRYARGEYDAAVKSFCRAADLEPTDARPIEFLGEMYGVSPDLAAEITERVARFAKAQPSVASGQYYYAMNLWRAPGSAETSEATLKTVESLLKRAVSLDPSMTKAHLQLGILLSEQRRFGEAIPSLVEAIRLDPNLGQAHYRLAQAYQRTGQKELAAREFAEFERLKPRK